MNIDSCYTHAINYNLIQYYLYRKVKNETLNYYYYSKVGDHIYGLYTADYVYKHHVRTISGVKSIIIYYGLNQQTLLIGTFAQFIIELLIVVLLQYTR